MKKFLAILLAITMIATFIPSAFAVEGEETPVYDVEVKCDLESLVVEHKMYGSVSSTAEIPLSTLNYENTDGTFKYLRSSLTTSTDPKIVGTDDVQTTEKLIYPGAEPKYDNNGYLVLYSGNYICFEVDVPKKGIYTLEVRHKTSTASTTTNMDVYIADADTYYSQSEFNFDNFGSAVGSCICKGGTYTDNIASIKCTEWTTTSIFKDEVLDAGKYIVTYKATGTGTKRAVVGTFTLKGISETNVGFNVKYDIQSVMKEEGMHNGKEADYPIADVDYNTTNGFFDVTGSTGTINYASTSSTPYNFIKLGKKCSYCNENKCAE